MILTLFCTRHSYIAEYKNRANRLIACKLVKAHQDCKNRKLKTTEKLFQAKFHVQKLKYLLGNLGIY